MGYLVFFILAIFITPLSIIFCFLFDRVSRVLKGKKTITFVQWWKGRE